MSEDENPKRYKASTTKSVSELIDRECEEIRSLLQSKNASYGNSALKPVRIFSKAHTLEQINVRIDDKLSRLQNGDTTKFPSEDTVLDLIGYLILHRIATKEL